MSALSKTEKQAIRDWLDAVNGWNGKPALNLPDSVKNPSHYQILPGVEMIDVRKALLNKMPEGVSPFVIDCWSRSFEYLGRMWGKNGLEDAKKARIYLNWMIKEMEGVEK